MLERLSHNLLSYLDVNKLHRYLGTSGDLNSYCFCFRNIAAVLALPSL
jgi:hypothetical protein